MLFEVDDEADPRESRLRSSVPKFGSVGSAEWQLFCSPCDRRHKHDVRLLQDPTNKMGWICAAVEAIVTAITHNLHHLYPRPRFCCISPSCDLSVPGIPDKAP